DGEVLRRPTNWLERREQGKAILACVGAPIVLALHGRGGTPAGSSAFPGGLPFQPRADLLHPPSGGVAEAGAAEVDALAAVVPELPLERVGVRALERHARLPERR